MRDGHRKHRGGASRGSADNEDPRPFLCRFRRSRFALPISGANRIYRYYANRSAHNVYALALWPASIVIRWPLFSLLFDIIVIINVLGSDYFTDLFAGFCILTKHPVSIFATCLNHQAGQAGDLVRVAGRERLGDATD